MKFLEAFSTDDGKSLNKDHFGMAKYFHVYGFSKSALQGIDVVVGRRFGPNLLRLLKKFVCVVVRKDTIDSAIEAVHNNIDRVVQEKQRGENRKHIVLS